MPRKTRLPLADLSLGELKRLVAIKERMAVLEEKRERLQGELAEVQAAIAKLTGAPAASAGRRRKPGRKAGRKPTRKAGRKSGRQPARPTARRGGRAAAAVRPVRAAGTAAGKGVRKAGRRAGRKAGRRPGKAPAVAKRRAGGGGTLQEVVAGLIRAHGSPMAFQDILRTIQSRKLVKTKSKDFANVLRRTLSTSRLVKRVARGTYGVAA